MKIYNLGSVNIDYVYAVDHFVTAGETLSSESMRVFPGGKGLNQSVALARAGASVIHGAIVGDGGDLLTNALAEAGADVGRIEKRPGSCGHAIIQVDRSGQNSILLFAGTNHSIDRAYIESFLFDAEKDDVLLLQNEISGLDVIFEIAHKKKMQIAFNPSPYHESLKLLPLSYIKWWFCNEIEGAAFFEKDEPEEIAEAFLRRFPNSNLILTLGKEGSVFVNADTYIRQPIYQVPVVDTTAAGDTFTGYFIAAITSGKSAAFALDVASKAAAITVSRQGASVSIPTRNEVALCSGIGLTDPVEHPGGGRHA